MRRFAHHLVGDPERAQDALQEAYLKAFRAFHRFRATEPAAIKGWLSRIVYHSCIDELRSAKRSRPTTDALESSVDPGPGPERTVLARLALRQALGQLSADSRAAVLLVDAIGLDYRAAAEILRIPEGTLASRLSSARAALHRALSEPETHGRKADTHA
jgi:RNA polymerase sigma-70 factor (ECF subfamily)